MAWRCNRILRILYRKFCASESVRPPADPRLLMESDDIKVQRPPNKKRPGEKMKKSPGKRSSSDSYGSHYLGTMCLFAGGQAQRNQWIMLATSAAKSSSAFSMPSPVWKRVNALTVILPPSCLATSAMCFSTEVLFSFTKACCSRQFSS